jgi:ComF family protein
VDRLARALGALGDELECFFDAVFPRACRLCGAPAEDGFACTRHALPDAPHGPRCGRCASALPPSIPDGERCAECRIAAPSFSRVLALADYRRDASVQPWILAFKHGGRRDLAPPLASALAARCAASGALGARASLVPVPLHPLRRFERGYDQADLLARELAERLELPCVRALSRTRATPPQGTPGAVSRAANVRGAFAARWNRRRIAGRSIWLVDDVLTSGATASECARVLKRGGAVDVGVLCIARAGGGASSSHGADACAREEGRA